MRELAGLPQELAGLPLSHVDGTVAVFEDLSGNRWDLLQPKS